MPGFDTKLPKKRAQQITQSRSSSHNNRHCQRIDINLLKKMMVQLYRLQRRSLKRCLKPLTFVPDQVETIEIVLVVILGCSGTSHRRAQGPKERRAHVRPSDCDAYLFNGRGHDVVRRTGLFPALLPVCSACGRYWSSLDRAFRSLNATPSPLP